MSSLIEKIRLGRTWAHWHYPYLAPALHSLTLIESDKVPTMGVSKEWRCYWNPERVKRWKVNEIGAVLMHEAWHCLRCHWGRAQDLHVPNYLSIIWNVATDMEINDDMVGDEKVELRDCLLPQQYNLPNGKMAEWYYRWLLDNKVKIIAVPSYGGSCSDGSYRDWEERGEQADEKHGSGVSRADAETIAREVAANIKQKGRGSVPAGLERWAEEILTPPKVRWQSEVLSVARSCCAHVSGCWDYTYRKPSRRQTIAGEVIYPAMHRPVPEIAAVIDTSGSMSDRECGIAVKELGALLSQLGFPIRILSVDAALHHVQKAFGKVDRRLFGGGGTDMSLGIAEAIKLRPRPDLVVVLTDGETDWPVEAPAVPVLVVQIGESGYSYAPPSWAKLVVIPDDEFEETEKSCV